MSFTKIKIARQRGYIFNQINKLTIKIFSNRSNINIQYYLKIKIPIMPWQFFEILSQNPGYVKNHCNDRKNQFHFAWMIKQEIDVVIVQVNVFGKIIIEIPFSNPS